MKVGGFYIGYKYHTVVKCLYIAPNGNCLVEVQNSDNLLNRQKSYCYIVSLAEQTWYKEYQKPREFKYKVAILQNKKSGRLTVSEYPFWTSKERGWKDDYYEVLEIIEHEWVENDRVPEDQTQTSSTISTDN